MTNKQKIKIIIKHLKLKYPETACSLEYDQPYKLLIATRLAAQCTDARVNVVTKKLFKESEIPKGKGGGILYCKIL